VLEDKLVYGIFREPREYSERGKFFYHMFFVILDHLLKNIVLMCFFHVFVTA